MSKKQKKITAKEKCQQRLISLEKSIKSFEESYSIYRKEPDKNNNIMALVKSFEISFELSWKALKYFFEYKDIVEIKFARDIIKQAFQKNIIQDGQLWMDMLEDRNNLVHIYDLLMAKELIKDISRKYKQAIKNLYQTLQKEI